MTLANAKLKITNQAFSPDLANSQLLRSGTDAERTSAEAAATAGMKWLTTDLHELWHCATDGVWTLITDADKWGDGSDGDITFSSNTTLTANKQYKTVTINGGVIVNTDGYRVRAWNTVNAGTITDSSGGAAGTGGTGGAGTSGAGNSGGAPSGGGAVKTRNGLYGGMSGYGAPGGPSGVANSFNGRAGTDGIGSLGGLAGIGAAGKGTDGQSGNTGATGGTVGSSAGAGTGGNGGNGGNGGIGGGIVDWWSRIWNNTGTMHADGGDATAGSNPTTGSGTGTDGAPGGGARGGDGGFCRLVYKILTALGTIRAAAGASSNPGAVSGGSWPSARSGKAQPARNGIVIITPM